MKYFRMNELAPCFNKNGARCRECKLKQPANKLPDGVEENLRALVDNVLDPVREKLGKPIKVNSGFRCPLHNRTIGGVGHSQHLYGEAADIVPVNSEKMKDKSEVEKLGQTIEELGKFDQLIYYPTFIHVSWKRNSRNRKQILK